jgi:hypothetical protein
MLMITECGLEGTANKVIVAGFKIVPPRFPATYE